MELFLPGFLAALVLVGIHAYLGLHVITRGVIFVDLAMAQAAALGSVLAFLYGFGPEHPLAYAFSLGLALVNAVFFALGRSVYRKIPEEGIIGLNYAILSAAGILLLNKAPHGAERIRDLLAGQVLYVSWGTVGKTALLYAVVGLVHFIWRRKFLMVSMDPKEAARQGVRVWFWDFLFYATFGLVITSSVAIGGVLLVFTLLVGPALLGASLSDSPGRRLAISYGFGFLVPVVGFGASLATDYPTGATVVVAFGLFLLPVAIVRYALAGSAPLRRGALVLGALVVLVAGMVGAWHLRPGHPAYGHHGDPKGRSKGADSGKAHRSSGSPTPALPKDGAIHKPSAGELDALRRAFAKPATTPISSDRRAGPSRSQRLRGGPRKKTPTDRTGAGNRRRSKEPGLK